MSIRPFDLSDAAYRREVRYPTASAAFPWKETGPCYALNSAHKKGKMSQHGDSFSLDFDRSKLNRLVDWWFVAVSSEVLPIAIDSCVDSTCYLFKMQSIATERINDAFIWNFV